MLRVTDIFIPIDNRGDLASAICKRLHINREQLVDFSIYRESFDARKEKQQFVYTVDIAVQNEQKLLAKGHKGVKKTPDMQYQYPEPGNLQLSERPIVVGSGPCGLFAALILANKGYQPLLLERGADVDTRTKIVNDFWTTGQLQLNTNVQFGEGGAGTFSDGKLTTNIKDKRCRYVLECLVNFGAPAEIKYSYQPHVGTDKLRDIVKSIRQAIIAAGGQVEFNTTVNSVEINQGRVTGVWVNQKTFISASLVILAIGHSARDTYHMLFEQGVPMEAKAFSIGLRVEHLQAELDKAQYEELAGHRNLDPATYRLKYHDQNGRSAYSFCMCPGGVVVASSSNHHEIVTNGMSYHARDGVNANSALLVGVNPTDFSNSSPLAGLQFQQHLEKAAYQLGGSNYHAPVQLVGDFLARRETKTLGRINPSYKPGVKPANLMSILPNYVTETLISAIKYWGKQISGFDDPEAVLTGVETRSSAPVRIIRNDDFLSEVTGLYPAGEGAGYAGGIVSAAVDGMRVAEAIMKKYRPIS